MVQGAFWKHSGQRIGGLLRKLQFSQAYQENTQVALASLRFNNRRLAMLTLIAIPVHIAVIIQFLTAIDTDLLPAESEWRRGIILTHAVLLLLMIIMNLVVRKLRDTQNHQLLNRIIHHLMVICLLSAGIVITVIDQLVTTNITPFLIVCLLISLVFLIRPLHALIYYFVGYVSFFIMIAWHDVDRDIMLSNRVNGLAVAALGFLTAYMLWRYNLINFRQRRQILEQQRLLEEKNRELEQMAFFDPLTTLPNRRFFDEVVGKEIALIRRGNRRSCLVMLDIDHFKDINDTYGHPTGDMILKQVSLLLKSCIRQSDLIARLGGEEFIILLPDTGPAGAGITAEKLRDAIERMSFLAGTQVLHVTASFGVAPLLPNRDGQINYYASCDLALYKAKQNGRNRVESAVTA